MNLKKTFVWLLFLSLASYVHADDIDRVFVVYNAANGLADNSAQTIKCSPSGRLLTSTIGQINFYDGSTFTHIDPSQEALYPLPNYNGHYHPYIDRHHRYWLKNRQTVTCLDLATERFIPDISAIFREMGADYEVEDFFVPVTIIRTRFLLTGAITFRTWLSIMVRYCYSSMTTAR